MNDLWKTDNDSDEDLDSSTRSIRWAFSKEFLLKKPPDRGEPKQPTQPTRTQGTPEKQAKPTESDNILQSILYLKKHARASTGRGRETDPLRRGSQTLPESRDIDASNTHP